MARVKHTKVARRHDGKNHTGHDENVHLKKKSKEPSRKIKKHKHRAEKLLSIGEKPKRVVSLPYVYDVGQRSPSDIVLDGCRPGRSLSLPVNMFHFGMPPMHAHRPLPKFNFAALATRGRTSGHVNLAKFRNKHRNVDVDGSLSSLDLDAMLKTAVTGSKVKSKQAKSQSVGAPRRTSLVDRMKGVGHSIADSIANSKRRISVEVSKTLKPAIPVDESSSSSFSPSLKRKLRGVREAWKAPTMSTNGSSDTITHEKGHKSRSGSFRKSIGLTLSMQSPLLMLANQAKREAGAVGYFTPSSMSTLSEVESNDIVHLAKPKLPLWKKIWYRGKIPRKKATSNELIRSRLLFGDFQFDILDPTDFERTKHWGVPAHFKEVGRGNSGQVFKGTFVGQRIEVLAVVKFYYDWNVLKREYTFLNYLKAISLPFVPKIYGYYTLGKGEEERNGIVMDYVSSTSIGDIFSKGLSLPCTEWMHLMFKITQSLGILHGIGVLHNDIKDENIMVGRLPNTNEIVAFFIDFANASDLKGMKYPVHGVAAEVTPVHLAPELLDGNKTTEQSDIFSLGVLFLKVVSQAVVDEQSFYFKELNHLAHTMVITSAADRASLHYIIHKLKKYLEKFYGGLPPTKDPLLAPHLSDVRRFSY